MSQNINIGTFSWDSDKISQDLSANKKELERFSQELKKGKEELKKTTDAFGLLGKKIESETRSQERLKTQLSQGYISREKYNKEIEKSNQRIEVLVDQELRLAETQSKLIISTNSLEQSIKNLRQENTDLNKIMASSNVVQKLSIENYQTEGKSVSDLRKEKSALVKLRDQENGSTELSKKKILELNDAIEKNTQAQKGMVSENEKRYYQIGQYKEAINSAFSEISIGATKLLSGDLQGGFEAIRLGLQGITKDAKAMFVAFATNPIAIVLSALSGIAYGIKQIWDYNTKQLPKVKLIQDKFGDLGKDADILRNKINAVSETFGSSFERIINTVDNISSSGLASEAQAIEAISKGLATAPNADEFLSKLDAAASKARQTGLSLTEVLNLTKALQGTAINPEKIYGELEKSAGNLQLGLKKNLALVSAFGEAYTRDLLTKIQKGELTTVQALESVKNKTDELGISLRQKAELGKELFGKLSSNAGAYDEILNLVHQAYKDQFSDLTNLQKLTVELYNANYKLAEAKDEAMKSDSVIALKYEFEIFWKQLQIGYYKFLGYIKVADREFKASAVYMRGVFLSLPKEAGKAFGSIIEALDEMIKGFASGGKAISLFFKGDFDAAKAEANKFMATLPAFKTRIEKSISNLGSGLNTGGLSLANKFRKEYDEASKAKAEALKMIEAKGSKNPEVDLSDNNSEKSRKKAEAEAKKAENKRIAEAKKAQVEAEKALKEEAKRALEIARNTAEQMTAIAKNELAEYIALNAEKYKDDKSLSKKKLQDQLDYFENVRSLQKKLNDEEKTSKLFSIQQKIDEINKKKDLGKELSQNDIAEIKNLSFQKENIEKEYQIKDLTLTKETHDKKKDLEKKYDSDVFEQKNLSQAIEFQQRLLNLESQGASEYELRQVQLDQETQQKLENFFKENDLLKKLDEDNYISKTEIDATRKDLEAEIKATDDLNEQLRLQNQLNILNNIEEDGAVRTKQITKDVDDFKIQSRAQVLNGLVNLFGRESALGKAFAAAEITNNTVTQATKAFQQGAVFASNPFTAALAVNSYIQGGLIIATGAAQLAKLVTPKKEGYYAGGYTGDGGKYDPAGIVHKGEVVWSQADVKAIGGPLIANALRPTAKGGYYNGGIVGGSNLATVQNTVTQSLDISVIKEVLRDAAFEGTANGSSIGSQKGFENLSESRKIANSSYY